MTTYCKASIPLIALLICSTVPVLAGEDERVETKTFEVDADVKLRLEAFKGRIEVRTAAIDRVEMTAVIYPDEGPSEDLELVELRTSGSRSTVRIEVEYDRELTYSGSSSWFGSSDSRSLPFVDIEILMPDDGNLFVESHKSTFDVEAPSGEVVIESHKGTGTVENVRGDFELDTHKGEFEVVIDELRHVLVDTHKGDIDLTIRDNGDFTIRAETNKGSLRFQGRDIPVERDDDGERSVSYTVGNGQNLIDLDTHKGRISVEFTH